VGQLARVGTGGVPIFFFGPSASDRGRVPTATAVQQTEKNKNDSGDEQPE